MRVISAAAFVFIALVIPAQSPAQHNPKQQPALAACRKNGGDLEQIKFLFGQSLIQTTERYLGSEQEIVVAVNGNLGL